MNVSMNVNGQSKVPPGFRFHPTEEELLHYYLKKKVAYEEIDLDVIQEVDLNKLEPWDIEVKCNIGSTEQNDWYFFSHKDKKYPTGTRTNRATAAGFWKATGRDKVIHSSLQRIGMRKTLVFYNGRAPHGQKSDWIMHEYRLDDNIVPIPTQDSTVSNLCDCSHQEGWVICRVFKKKNYNIKSFGSPQRSLSGSMDTRTKLQSLNKDGVLEQLLMFMDNNKSCKQETRNFTTTNDDMHQFVDPINDTFFHLPVLDSPTMNTSPHLSSTTFDHGSSLKTNNSMRELLEKVEHPKEVLNTMDDFEHCSNWTDPAHPQRHPWADLDKFVASQLDGQMEETKEFSSCFGEPNEKLCFSVDHDEQDVWSLATSSLSSSSSMDPLCHLSV